MTKLSVAIITKNEEHNIKRCLESVKWADEIVILDSGSEDNTMTICKEYTDNAHHVDWPGYGVQRNRAIDKCQNDWVLMIDADEVLSDELIKEIKATMANPNYDAYLLNVRLIFFGKEIRYAVGSDKHIRLFRKSRARFSEDIVHEKVLFDGERGELKATLRHYSVNSIEELIDNINTYTTLSAKMKYEKGKRHSIWRAVFSGLWMFTRLYILNLGFLDGRAGFVLAISHAEGSYYRYLKCHYMNETN